MMSSVLYLEQFIESLEPLPGELQKNFHEMRKMDEKVELQKATAESMSDVSFFWRIQLIVTGGDYSTS